MRGLIGTISSYTTWSRGFFFHLPIKMVRHGDGFPRASSAKHIMLSGVMCEAGSNFPLFL